MSNKAPTTKKDANWKRRTKSDNKIMKERENLIWNPMWRWKDTKKEVGAYVRAEHGEIGSRTVSE